MANLPAWVFERSSRMGGAAGEAFSNILASSGMHPAGVLAREAIQNSVDAKAKGSEKVSMRFAAKSLIGSDKADFVAASGIGDLLPRYTELTFKEPNTLQTLNEPDRPLPLLFIEDHATTGLEGDPSNPESKFYRFLLSLGDGGKEHDEHGTGGSYGYGKSVYSSSSGILTIFAYSRTRNAAGDETSLLFGCGYYRKHKDSGVHFTGRAWFGDNQTDPSENAQQVVEPLIDEDADAWAAKLGFESRANGDFGTTVLIVDSNVETAEILRGVEDWWWPRLIDHLLDVEVSHPDGTVEHPRPRKREDLRPFLECYDIAIGRAPPKPKVEARKPLNKLDNTSLGTIGLKVLDRDADDTYVVGEQRLDAVALIRSPLMVVAYYRQWPAQFPGVVGTFVASDEVDDVLRASEPPAHDRWDSEARRLQEPTGRDRQIVERVLSAIKRHLRQFQTGASPPPPAKPKRLSLLERTLASFLTASKGGTLPGPVPSNAPISLSYESEPHVMTTEDGRLRLAAAFSVRPKPDYDGEVLRLKVKAVCSIIEDGQAGDALPMVVNSSSSEAADLDGWHEVELSPGDVARFQCETEPYDNAWTVRFTPEVQPLGGTA
jgi:hypothetical protein